MRFAVRISIPVIAAACAAMMVTGCGGGGGGTGGGGSTVTSQSLVGNVFDSATGNPVGGATVELASQTVQTDASGNYQFESLPADFAGGDATISAGGFDTETATVTQAGSALQVAPVGLTPAGADTSVAPGSGAVVSASVAEAPGLPAASLTIPSNALPAGANVSVGLTSDVEVDLDGLVDSLSVRGQTVGDVSSHRPEIRVKIRPEGLALNAPAQITLPLPFALPPGSPVPILQRKNGVWREVGTATVNDTGAAAVGQISEFRWTGAACWHSFHPSTTTDPAVPIDEVSLSSIGNSVRNLPDRSYVVDRVVQPGRLAKIVARFAWTYATPDLPTSPVDEQTLVLGRHEHRDRLRDRLFRGPWFMPGGPVTFSVRESSVTVKRVLAGTPVSDAGSFVVTRGQPSWPRPSAHNQGSVQ